MNGFINWKTMTATAVLVIGLGLYWLISPVYAFFAHNGAAPFTPFGWTGLPAETAPVQQRTHDDRFAAAGNEALTHLEAWRAEIGAPSLSAAVSIDGELVWAGSAGWADLRRQIPATPDTRYRIGSTSKAVTAIALARMVERGEIDLDVPVTTYLGEVGGEAWARITPRMLASHMSGLPHYGDNTETVGLYQMIALQRNFDDIRDAVAQFDESDLLFQPGEEFEYSSLGTVVLGAVMSEASGLRYRDLIAREVLEPAGANATMVAPKHHTDGLAQFYYRDDDRYRVWRPVDLSHRLPGGGWASTPGDLARIGALMLDEDIVSARVRDAFWTPQQLNSGETNEQDYALGFRWREWEIEGVGPMHNANHGGVSRGSQSWMMILPEYNMVIAVNMNAKTDPFWEFGGVYEEIARAFVPLSSPVQLSQ